MATYEQKDNSGSLFKNDKREKDTHANARGKAMIGGVMYYIDAWTNESAKGKYQSLKFKPIDPAQQSAPAQIKSQQPGGFPDGIDDVPF